jgi:asparagine synthase (glutamine-hydrolysing)
MLVLEGTAQLPSRDARLRNLAHPDLNHSWSRGILSTSFPEHAGSASSEIDISGAVDFSNSPDPCLSSWINQISRFELGFLLSAARCTLASTIPVETAFLSPEAGFLIAADAELHNRGELLASLASAGLPPSCSDASLILSAYEKWGEDCPEHLLGEFSFAIWDARRDRLFCCKDHFGMRPFFYWTSGSRFAFASEPLSLFAIPEIDRKLNDRQLAALATPARIAGSEDETVHRGIMSLPAASCMSVERGKLRKRIYWTPGASSVIIPKRQDEAFEALRELLFKAVDCRLERRRQIAVFLSGGLDSSAVVSIAARSLARRNLSLLAIAAVLPSSSKPEFSDEREFVEEFRAFPNVDIEYVAPEEGGPFDRIDNRGSFDLSPFQFSRGYLMDAMQAAAVRNGAEIVIGGMGGEFGPTTPGHGYYLELASRFRWLTLSRELARLRVTRHISPIRMLAREGYDFLSPDRNATPRVLFAPDFLATMEENPHSRTFHRPDHRQEQANRIRSRMAGHSSRRATNVHRVPMTAPFFDKDIVEFCLAATGDMKVRDGYQRYLIRRALDGILPKKIQWRTSKCLFAPDYFKRYKTQIEKARQFVAAIRRGDPVRSVVDLDRLASLLDRPETPAGRSAALALVPTTVYLICFLRQFREFQQ